VEKLDDLIQDIKQEHLEAECEEVTSSGDISQQLSPCAVDSIKRVNSLKKDFQAGLQRIEKSIQNESTITSTPPPAQKTPIATANTTVENRCTPEAVMQDCAQEEKEVANEVGKEKVVTKAKVEKELFKEREKVKPQRQVAATSRLLMATRSNSAKRVMPAKRQEQSQKDNQAAVAAASSSSSSSGAKPRCASAGVRRRPTQGQAPTFMSRASRPSDVKLTSEEMELKKVEEEKRAAEKQMKSFQRTFQVLKTKGAIPGTVRSVKELTIPMTPCFPTDEGKRRRVFPDEHREEVKKPAVAPKARSGPTVPSPFQFATSQRASIHGDGEKSHEDVHTSGECIEQFMKNTRSTYVPKKAASGVTHPKAPTFRTEQRCSSAGRPKPLSRDELEEKEMRAAQAMSFKAKPVNKKIFDSMGVNGVPKVQVKECTTFSEFHLSSDDRAAYHKAHKPPDTSHSADEHTSFKALEMPDFSKAASRPHSPCHASPKLTEAHSPKLHGGQRSSSAPARRQKMSHEEAEKKKLAEANAWRLKIKQKMELTNPVDMKLKSSERGNASEQALRERIKRQMQEEKKATEVHATPFNEKIFKKSFSVSTSQKELTEFSEFKLQTDERHQLATIKSMENMQDNLKNKAEFHARPVPASLHQPGFKPSPSEKEPVTPLNIHLSSERRSLQRQSFDAAVSKAKEDEKDRKDKQMTLQHDKENFELSNLRRAPVSKGGMCFKASKVLSKDPFPVKHVHSTPLTEPRSPNLRTALRTRVNE
jgi:hypothetical protein